MESRVDPLALTRELPIDVRHLRAVVERLAGVGSSPLGFRTTGTPEDREVAEYAATEMRFIGLAGVAVEEVKVDGWRFEGASLEAVGDRIQASSMGGVPPTPPGGLEAPLVDAGAAEPRRLDRLDLTGAIALVDWRREALPLCDIALELGLRGAVGVVANCPAGADFYQSEGVIGSFDGHWHEGAPPMILIAKEDAAALRVALPERALMTLDAERSPGTRGANAVGFLAGESRGAPIVVGAHHDGWFRAAFDNASGVAAMLGIARALAAVGHRPRHPICFTSRTAEEYGLEASPFDWCIGAWRQVQDTHPEWGARSPFHLCVEASGHPDLRLALEAPVEIAEWARAACRAGRREGRLTSSWRIAPPGIGTELWPLLVSGIRLDPADAGKVNPSIPHWGGPNAVGASTALRDKVYSYGNSELRGGVTQLSPKEGYSLGDDAGGWTHSVYTVTPGIPGDSGSAFLSKSGAALGVLSTVAIAPVAGSNGVGDVAKEVAYMKANSAFSGVSLALGTEPFVAGPLP